MKFHRITLRDYKGIRHVTIEPRETGVTIIEGENEVGKSSIAEALWFVFEQTDDSASQAVRGLKPAGRDASTEIEVEVSTGPYRFTYFKRFHRGSRTELRIAAPREETLTGREAHNRARQILDETIDRALWEALRLQQGSSLEPLNAGEHQSLLGALDVAASELLGGDREQTLFERVETEYLRYWTPSGREKASGDGANAPRLRRTRDEANEEVGRIASRIAALEERAIRSAELGTEIAELAETRAALLDAHARLSAAHDARKGLTAAVETAAARVEQLQARVRELGAALKARQDAEAAIAARVESRRLYEDELASSGGPLDEAKAAAEQSGRELSAAQEALAAAQRAATSAEDLVRLSERELQVTQMAERLGRVEQNEPELRDVVAWLNACRVDRRALQEIGAAEREVLRLESQRESEGASIEVSSIAEVTIEIDGQPARLMPGRSLTGKVPGETTLGLPGGIVVRIAAGAAARELDGAMEAARAAFAARLAAAGVESSQQARDTWDDRIQKEERRKFLVEQIRADLRDLTAEGLRDKLSRERAAIAAIRDGAHGGVPETLEAAKAARDAAVADVRAAAERVRSLSLRAGDAKARLEALERRQLELSARLQSADEELERQNTELERLRQDSDGPMLAERLAAAKTELEAEAARLEQSKAAVADVHDVSTELAASAGELSRVERAIQAAREQRAADAGVLEAAGAEGLHGQLVEAEQRQGAATEELAAYERRANAARTLFEAMRRRREEARENYAEPLRRAIELLGKQVLGESFGIELTDDLRIAKVTRQGITLEVSQLSVGLREQLSVLTRLACASLVSEKGGAPVVLDDIFGWADPARLEKLGPVLAESAKETQVLLFTCHPHRFDSVAPARVISLPSGKIEDRGAAERGTAGDTPARPAGPAPRSTPGPSRPAPQAAFDLFGEPEPAGKR